MRIAMVALIVAGIAIRTASERTAVFGPTAGDALGPEAEPGGTAQVISVMSRNVYYGADLDAVIAALANADPTDDLSSLLAALQTLRATDFPTRAGAIAEEIARTRPHVVGLQEVAIFDVDLTWAGLPVDMELPFLPIIQGALAGRGLNYTVAAIVQNFDVSPLSGVRMQDFDVLLVDADRVTVHSTIARIYENNLGEVAPGIVLNQGWIAATITAGETMYTVVSTHLASGGSGGRDPQLARLRAAQAMEIATALAATNPAIVMGDLNDWPGSPMHRALAGAGFTDVWSALRPGVIGYTCCHDSDLANQDVEFEERIDYVWVRDIGHPRPGIQGRVEIVGASPADRVAGPYYPLWPSDHAGLFVQFVMPPEG